MLQRLRQISISSSLRGAFLTGALLTLIVSSVSLYSWHEQSSQIRYSLDEYFPRIHAAFLIEGNLNLVVDQLNEFLLAPNTTVRLQLRNQIIQHLDKIPRFYVSTSKSIIKALINMHSFEIQLSPIG